MSEKFEPKPEAEKIILSAKRTIATILQMSTEVLLEHKRALLSRMIWKITEAHGKYNTRFCSEGALQNTNDLQHDHVATRQSLISRLIDNPSDLENILIDAVGCTLTTEEHKKLSAIGNEFTGWKRYEKARITVFDRAEQKLRK